MSAPSHLLDGDPGTTAVVHGMLATMAELLERLEDRLSTLEATVVGQTTATRTAAQRLATELPEAVVEPLRDRLAALAGLDARLADVEAAVSRPDTSVLEQRIDALAEAVAPPDLRPLADAVDAARSDMVAALERRLGSLAAPDLSGLEAKLDALTERLDALQPQPVDLSGIEARLDALHVEPVDLSAIEARIDALRPEPVDLSGIEARLDALPAQPVDLSAVEARLDELVASGRHPTAELGDLLDERLAAVTAGIAELLATAAAPPADPTALALGLARLEADLAEARAETAMAVQGMAERVESAVADVLVAHANGNASPAARVPGDDVLARLADRVAQLHEALNRSRGETVSAVDDMAARLARIEATVASAHDHEDARATALASELRSLLGAGLERLLAHSSSGDEVVAADVRSTLARLGEVAVGVESLSVTLGGVAEAVTRLAGDERGRSAVTAVEAAAREQQEALSTFHASLMRRIDGRTAALARLLEGLEIDRLAGEVADRQAATTRMLEQVAAALGDEQRRLESVQSLCQAVAGAVDQHAAVGSRVAELVLETRSAMRADVERLESGLHLDSVKRQQHDQARLAQVAAGVSEVVERETALVAQRVAALAATVESLRNGLHASIE